MWMQAGCRRQMRRCARGEAAQKVAVEVSRAARPTSERLAKLRGELGALRDEVAALKPWPLAVPDTRAGRA